MNGYQLLVAPAFELFVHFSWPALIVPAGLEDEQLQQGPSMLVLKPLTRNDAVAIGSAEDGAGWSPPGRRLVIRNALEPRAAKPSWPRNSAGGRETIFAVQTRQLKLFGPLAHATSNNGPKSTQKIPSRPRSG